MPEINILPNSSLATNDTLKWTEWHEGHPAIDVYSPEGWKKTELIPTLPPSETGGVIVIDMVRPWMIPSLTPQGGALTLDVSYKQYLLRLTAPFIPLRAGQRYLFKLTSTQNVYWVKEAQGENPLMVRGGVVVDGTTKWGKWQPLKIWGGRQETIWLLVEANEMSQVDFVLELWQQYGTVAGRIALDRIEALEEPLDWGSNPVVTIGTPDPAPAPITSNPLLPWLIGGGVILLLPILVVIYLLMRNAIGAQAMDANEGMTNLVNLINVITYMPFMAAITVFVTQFWKTVQAQAPERFQVNPGIVALTVQVLLWAAYYLAKHYGLDLTNAFTVAADLIKTAGPVILGLLGSAYVAHKSYQGLKAGNVPGFKKA